MDRIQDKAAKLIRVVSIPPVDAAILIIALTINGDCFTDIRESITAFACLALLPLLAYPTASLFRKEKDDELRNMQRGLAFIFSAAGYVLLFAAGLILKSGSAAMTVFSCYLFSVLLLLIVNKLTPIKASGHSCAVTGPSLILCAYIGRAWLLLCPVGYVLVLLSSVRLKRHTPAEFFAGSACFIGAYIISELLF